MQKDKVISCEDCAYNTSETGACDIHGIRGNAHTLCRAFRMPKQPHRAARKKWPMVGELAPGSVYQIESDAAPGVTPQPFYQIERVGKWKPQNGVTLDRYTGCLLGGAVGDALGAPIEFMQLAEIRRRFGANGLADYVEAYGRRGAITDDTQMTLFTAEGLLRAFSGLERDGVSEPASFVHHAYIRWLNSQGEDWKGDFNRVKTGWLINVPELYARRAPGNTCISALCSGVMGTTKEPVNSSKGCGGVMRVAPVGLFCENPSVAFDLGCEVAAITHGHPSGFLAAGTLAAIISMILSGESLDSSVLESVRLLTKEKGHEECLRAIETALGLVHGSSPSPEVVERIGAGWVAEEALAISLYCSLVAGNDFSKGVLLAVNHGGDSDSTGAITGNILGTVLGEGAIPKGWLRDLELREVIEEVATDLFLKFRRTATWSDKYPGW